MAGDYDYEPKEKPGQFIRLRDKGQSVSVRIASKPWRFPVIWKIGVQTPMDNESVGQMSAKDWFEVMKNPDFNVTETFAWVVIDREDGHARILQGTPGVYKSIKELAAGAWGNPETYDIQVTRTETPGRGYYSVTPLPNKDTITPSEMEEVGKINIPTLMPHARPTAEKQVDDVSDYIAGLKAADEAAAAKPDITIEDIPDDINLDDIPFKEDDGSVSKSPGKVL